MKDRFQTFDEKARISRRRFLGATITAAGSLGLTAGRNLFGIRPVPDESSVEIRNYRLLGRTGFRTSDIGLGSNQISDPAMLEAVLAAGVNYIDTAESYYRGKVEETIGSVLKNHDRKSLFISTKLGMSRFHRPTKEAFCERARKCLERLRTDVIDCLMIHGAGTVEEMKSEGFHAAVSELKAEGRIRFCGISNHGSQWSDASETMEQVLGAAAEDGRFDVMLLVYNFVQRDMGEKILKLCREKNIGATVMKSNPVEKYRVALKDAENIKVSGREVPVRMLDLIERFKSRADLALPFIEQHQLKSDEDVRRAAIRFILGNPDVNTVCCSMKNYDDIRSFVSLSGSGARERSES